MPCVIDERPAEKLFQDDDSKFRGDVRNYDVTDFSLSDVIQCGAAIREAGRDTVCMEQTASNLVRYLYDHFLNPETGERDVALIRLFKTHAFGDLDEGMRLSAIGPGGGDDPSHDTKCLVLLGTAGDEPQWNSRSGSRGHQAIPLRSEQAVSRIPMIAQLIMQFGLPIGTVLNPSQELMIDLDERTYNVFYVPEALNSPHIPGQDFVRTHKIRSVLGFGGMLPTGNLFAVIVFSKVHISLSTAEVFRTVALNTKLAILPFEDTRVFLGQATDSQVSSPRDERGAPQSDNFNQLRSKAAALEELGKAYDQTVLQQSERIRRTVRELERTNGTLLIEIETRKQLENERTRLSAQLVERSRLAGMAEVATGVLHNVGNVLNSVNVSTTIVAEQLKTAHVDDFAKAVAMMDEHADDLGEFITRHERGKHLPAFLKTLSTQLRTQRDGVVSELTGIVKHIEHVKEIVALQQSFARVGGATQQVDLVALFEEAVKMSDSAFVQHNITVVRDFEHVEPLESDKHKVLQILINLLSNAKHALQGCEINDKQVVLRIVRESGESVRLEVQDNGVGITAENLIKIFAHGFTTKRNGHGFGLHSSALAAKELGGLLTAHSDGPGHGAKFILSFRTSARKVVP